MPHINYKRYGLYLLRWQLSTPILAVALKILGFMGAWTATIVANLIGGLVFFWVDNFIFTSKVLEAQWEVLDDVLCADCGVATRGYRLVKTLNYDKAGAKPEFRCEMCSKRKTESLRKNGIKV